MNRLRSLVLAALYASWLIGSSACMRETEGELAPLRDPAEVQVFEVSAGELNGTLQVHPRRVAFGGAIEVEVEVQAPASFTELAWDQGYRAGHLQLLSLEALGLRREGDTQRARWRARFEASRSGRALGRLSAARAKSSSEATSIELSFPTFAIEVDPLGAGDAPGLADLPRPLDGIAIPSERTSWMWFAALAALLLSCFGLTWLWRRRRIAAANAPPPDPRVEAHKELADLRRAGLIESEHFGEYYYRLTQIVRTYLERATGLRAPERTTEEFLREIENHPAYPSGAKQELRDFLSAADLVKYAAQRPGPEMAEEGLRAAARLIDSIQAVEVAAT